MQKLQRFFSVLVALFAGAVFFLFFFVFLVVLVFLVLKLFYWVIGLLYPIHHLEMGDLWFIALVISIVLLLTNPLFSAIYLSVKEVVSSLKPKS